MRVATFNCENLFLRATVLNLGDWAQGRGIMKDMEALNSLLARPKYTPSIKSKIEDFLLKYEFENTNKKDRPFDIAQARDKLFSFRGKPKRLEVVAEGRESWVGWVAFSRTDLDGEEVHNTGRVIAEIKPDVQCVVEVENRVALNRFNRQVLSEFKDVAFDHNMSIVGSDPRGIDVGLLTRYPIVSIRSHIDEGGDKPIFSRDCPEYEMVLPNGDSLWLLGNHLKSQGFGSKKDNDAKRMRQADAVARIYREARKRSDYVIVAGDMNGAPDSEPMKPLTSGTDLKEVMSHPAYQGPPGTYATCKSPNQKFDYIMLSPALWKRVKAVGLEQRGIFHAKKPDESFDTVTSRTTSASDHAAVWVDLDM